MKKHDEYMERALLAEFVPMHLVFAGIPTPKNQRPDTEEIPGRDDLEECNR